MNRGLAFPTLRRMGYVVSIDDVAEQLQRPRGDHYTSVLVQKWRDQGFLMSAGARSGLYYNLLRVRARDGQGDRKEVIVDYAVQKLSEIRGIPMILVGKQAIHRQADWVDDAGKILQVAIPKGGTTRTMRRLDNVRWVERSQAWFDLVESSISRDRDTGTALLDPAWCLADAWVSGDIIGELDPDLNLNQEAAENLRDALDTFSADDDAWELFRELLDDNNLDVSDCRHGL